MPLVTESLSWDHGVFLGSIMSSEKTAAAAGTVGEVRALATELQGVGSDMRGLLASGEVRQMLERHIAETEGQIQRLEQVLDDLQAILGAADGIARAIVLGRITSSEGRTALAKVVAAVV